MADETIKEMSESEKLAKRILAMQSLVSWTEEVKAYNDENFSNIFADIETHKKDGTYIGFTISGSTFEAGKKMKVSGELHYKSNIVLKDRL